MRSRATFYIPHSVHSYLLLSCQLPFLPIQDQMSHIKLRRIAFFVDACICVIFFLSTWAYSEFVPNHMAAETLISFEQLDRHAPHLFVVFLYPLFCLLDSFNIVYSHHTDLYKIYMLSTPHVATRFFRWGGGEFPVVCDSI